LHAKLPTVSERCGIGESCDNELMSAVSELRKLVGRTMERLRVKAKKTTNDPEACAIIGSSRSLLRMEAGVKTRINFATIGRLCDYYGAPPEVKYELERLWRLADAKIWAQPSHAIANSGWDSYLEFEQLALALWQFQTMVPPGLCQTEAFMQKLFERSGVARERIPILIRDRLRRQAQFKARLGEIRYRVLLSEAVLRSAYDDEQHENMLWFDAHPNVSIKYLPFDGAPYPMLDVPFSVLSFRDHEDPSIIYLESPYERRFYEISGAVGQYHQIFEGGDLRAKSLKEFHQ
jgi:hypothetical protein